MTRHRLSAALTRALVALVALLAGFWLGVLARGFVERTLDQSAGAVQKRTVTKKRDGADSAHGKGPVWRALRDVAALPDAAARRAELLDRLDHVWEQALSKSYVNKHGDEIPNPDLAIAKSVIETAAELVGATHEATTGKGARPVDLSVFNGGASAPRKVAG